MKSSRYIAYTIIGLATTASTLCVGSPTDANLKQINHNIHNIKQVLVINQQQQHEQQQALESIETQAAHIALQLHKTNQDMNVKVKDITVLQAKLAQYATAIASQRESLSTNIKTIYMLGQHSDLQLLLGQNDPAKIERTLTYYHYLNKQHTEQINQLKNTLTQAQNALATMQQNLQELSKLKAQEQEQLASIKGLKQKRSSLIIKIKNNILSESQQLQILLANKQRLEDELRALSANPLLFQAIGKPFSQLKRHLSWPTKGKLIAQYGTKFDKSQLILNSVLFTAPLDQPVYAVADGKVIFARWLEGYGLLIIIYHGQGYMTLYGRNHYLYKQTGDIVHAGDQIAAVGDTGGHETPSLYFAIRHNTLPINPIEWFKSS